MNLDSVEDEFAGAGPLHQECLPLPFLSPPPRASLSPLPTPPGILSLVLQFWFVCVFLWRAEVPFVSSPAPSCFLRQGLSLNSPIQSGWLATRPQGPAYLCFPGAGIMGGTVFTEGSKPRSLSLCTSSLLMGPLLLPLAICPSEPESACVALSTQMKDTQRGILKIIWQPLRRRCVWDTISLFVILFTRTF